MPLPRETEWIVQDQGINSESLAADPEKFLIYAWEGKSCDGGGNWKITVPLTVASQTPQLFPLLEKRKRIPPRITLGKPGPPEPPIIMGGGVPILGLTASTRIDPDTKRRSDEYKLLRSQALPSQERHEYQAYPRDIRPGQRHRDIITALEQDQMVYHCYLALAWQYLGLQDQILDCMGNLDSACIGHYLPPEMLQQSISADKKREKRQVMRFSSALRHRMEAFISQGKIALLVGNLRAVAMQIETITGEIISASEVRELENFQAFEELAALDRGLPVLYLYPFYNIYEMERAEERLRAQNRASQKSPHKAPHKAPTNMHSKELSYNYPLRELRCLLQPGPLQQKLEIYTAPSSYFGN